MKALATLAIAIMSLPPTASAQTRQNMAHAETAAALKCLLDHRQDCSQNFAGRATGAAIYWLRWTPDKDFKLGALLSSDYAGTESVNAYTTRYLNGRPADVYDVKFRNQRKTFYIAPPGPDGKVRYIYIRNGAPDDERADMWATTP